MEQRFAVLVEEAKPRIYKIPVNQTARLINEVPGRKVEVFESLNDARERMLAIIERAKASAKPSIAMFSTRPNPEDEELLKTLSELTEDRVERYQF
jgi:hypothetical protein